VENSPAMTITGLVGISLESAKMRTKSPNNVGMVASRRLIANEIIFIYNTDS
jgi:hypothetical protein